MVLRLDGLMKLIIILFPLIDIQGRTPHFDGLAQKRKKKEKQNLTFGYGHWQPISIKHDICFCV